MPSCAHLLASNKKLEQIQNLVLFTKDANNIQLSTKLSDVWATLQSSITDARILLTLGADPSLLYANKYGERILNERIENGSICIDCSEKYRAFLLYAQDIYNAQYDQVPLIKTSKFLLHSNTNKKSLDKNKFIALSLDGGGMKGLVSVVILLFISRRVFGDESLPSFIDWYIGCSTGSMLGLSLAKGYSLKEIFFLYWEMKNEIFLDKSTMLRLLGNVVDKQTIRMNRVLDRCFPNTTDTFLNCSKRLTVPSLNIATSPSKLHTFRNYSIRSRDGKIKSPQDVTFKDAARASSAAPTYFHPHIIGESKFVDGSLVANCPLSILFREVDKCSQAGQPIKLTCVLSIGTGEPMTINRRYKCGKNLSGRGKHIVDVASLLMEQVVGHEKSALECAEDRCKAANIPFFS